MSKHPKFLGVAQAMLMSLLTILLLLGVASNQVFAQCGNISPLLCPEVVKTLPVNFTFNSSEGGLSNTGFTMAQDHSRARLTADLPITNAGVEGYEPSKLTVNPAGGIGGSLQLMTNKGIAFVNRDDTHSSGRTNTQVNTLGVGFVTPTGSFIIETTLINPNTVSDQSQQAGLWFGINDDNFFKIVVAASNSTNSFIEFRREVAGASVDATDRAASGNILISSLGNVKLRFVINPATKVLTAFYKYGTQTNYTQVGGNFTIPDSFLNGITLDTFNNITFAGIFGTHRNASTSIPFNFDDFSIQTVNFPPTFTASTLTTFDDLPIGTKIGKVNATDPEGQTLTYNITAGNTGDAFAINSQGEISINQDLTGSATYSLTVQVSDGVNPAVSGTVTINQKAVVTPTENINAKINFQDALDASLPSGYLKDFGQGFDLRTAVNQGASTLTYGWIGVNTTYPQQPADLTSLGRNRDVPTLDLKIRTFMHMEHPTVTNPRGYWEMAVPNGQYLVTVSVGEANADPSNPEIHRINAEGVNIINNFAPTGVANTLTRFTSGAKVVTVSDGRLTIDYAGGGLNTKINYVEVQSYVNIAPILANAIPNQTGNINTVFTYAFSANTFTDIEALTYTANLANNDPLPAWLTFDAGTRTFSGTPTTSATYTIKVIASDGIFSTNDEFDLVIEGIPNANPVISNANATFNIFENATSAGQVLAIDADAGQVLSYSITNGNTGNAFAIDANGNISVSGTLDYGTTPSYTLTVTVTDNGSPQKSVTGNYTVVLSENITTANFPYQINFQDANTLPPSGWVKDFGQPFGSRTNPQQGSGFSYGWKRYDNGADLDLTLNGRNRNRAGIPLLQNTLLHTQGNDLAGFSGTAIEGKWEITVPNGWYQVTVSVGDQPGANSVYDSQHTLNVEGINAINQFQATSSNEFNSATVTVQVTDGNLTIDAGGTNGNNTKINSAVIAQTTPPNQAPVLTIANFNVAEDVAVNATVATATASETVTYSLEEGTPFTMDANTGEIKLASTLNFETTASYTLNITATDGGSPALTDTETITVTVTNVNEAPTVENANFSVAENVTLNTLVGQITASDVDANTTLQYTLSGTGASDFAISNTGEITVASALNFEVLNSYALTVQVSDGTLTDVATVNISVTNFNESPVVTIADFSLPENQGAGAVATVTSNDPENQTVTYSLPNGTPFSIDENSGAISLNSALNFEANPAYTLNITATDGTNNISEEVIVTITNINEAPSIQNASLNLSEDANIGFEVLTVQASDPDANTTLQYQITAGNNAGDFAIDNQGKITVAGEIEFSEIPSYTLTVQVSDGEFTDEATINITVDEVIIPNQAPNVDAATFTIAENANINDVIGQVVAADLDGTIVLYEIIAGNEANKFEINASGKILVKNTLDFETATFYTLTVKVSDNGVPILTDEASVTINVTNVNESPAIAIADFSLPENQALGLVATVASIDPENQTVTYTLPNGTPFSIDGNSGAISLNSALNFETTTSYTLNITATDGTNNVSEEVIVSVTNVNEIPTVETATFTIAENVAVGTNVGQIVAADVDANTILQYALSGTGATDFAISNSGAITVANALEFSTIPVYNLTVTVTDNGSPELFANASVTINLTEYIAPNQNPVIVAQTFSIIENSAVNTNVGTVLASDPDATQTLTYQITAGNTNNTFAIDNNGALTVIGSLDFETLNSYALTVQVTDNANPSANASAIITVNITDEICSPISTLECNQILVSLPVNLNFDGTEGKLANTGFTMVDAYSGTRNAADGVPSNANVIGFEPSKLSVSGGRLAIQTNKGIAFVNNATNNQINTLGVQFGVTNQFKIETALVNPFVGSNAEQAGIWYGLNDATFLKLVINNGAIELRREIDNVSSTAAAASNPDQRLSGTIANASTSTIYLRLVINKTNNTAEGFYSTDGINYTSTGTNVAYTTPHVVLPAALATGNQYAGVFASHRNSNTSRTYTFENFKIEDTSPVNVAPTVANPIADQNATVGVAFNFAVPANTFADTNNDIFTLTASLADNSPLPAWLSFANGTFSGTPQAGDIANLTIKVIASDASFSVSDEFALNVSAPVNVAPTVANPIANQNATVGTAFNFTVPANTFADTNNDVLTLTASLADNSPLPAWLSFANGTFSGIPQVGDIANLSIKVTASDAGFSVSDEFALNVSNAIIPCTPISTLPCPQIKVPLNAPFVLNFTGSEGGLSNTGFTMVDAPSLRLVADGTISNPAVPGYEPSKLSFSNGKLIINANKGLAYVKPIGTGVVSTETNSQINTLGVGFDANDYNFSVQTTVINPYSDGSANSEQAGLWFGLDEANFVKLVAVNGSQIELRVEVGDNSDVVNLVAANGVTGLHTSNVTFRLQVNIAALTVTGFYKLNNGAEITVGTLPIPANMLNGKTINGEGISFAGVYASKRRELATTQVNYTFEDFSITPEIPINQAPVIAAQTFNVNENAGAGTLVGTVVATAPEANQALTFAVTPNNIFNINSSGQIVVVGALDYETTPSYNLNVTVTDNGIPQALSASATITVNINNLDPQIEITPVELVFDGVKNTTIGPKSVTVQNIGGDALTITAASISGTNANKFTTTAAPITLGIGESAIVQASFVPGPTVGYLNAAINFASNDPASPTKTVGLYGLSNNGFEGTNEPTFNNVVQALGYGINVGWTSLADGTSASPKGDEVLVPLFQRASAGEVTITPVARYSPTHQIFFGYYKNQGGTPQRTGVGELLPNSPHHQTLFPGLTNGSTTFNIDNSVFGIFVQGLQGRFTYTEDALNAGGPAIHAARIYPMKDRNGVAIPNSYLVAFEDASNGDYQDYVFVLSNVVPAGSVLGALQFAATPNNTSLQVGANGTIQNTLSTSNSSNVLATLNAEDNATNAVPTWLKIGGNSINNVNVNAGAPIIFEFDATGLTAGTYTATVTAAANSYDNATLNLTLTVTNPIVIKVNFQDNTVAAPSGYLKDIGEPFAARISADQGNGQYSFGWVNPANGQPVDLTTLGRTRTGALDLKIRTFNHMDHPTQTNPRGNWEIALPNGTYQVFASVGEPLVGTDPEVHRINAENVNIINNFTPTGAANALTRFTTGSGVATVTDGRLTLSYSGGGVNTKLNYVEVTSIQVSPGLQFAATPNSINLEIGETGTIGNALATNNSTDPVTATLNAIDNATNAVPTWLKVNNASVNNISFTTGAEISFVADATGLSAGNYIATVTASTNGYTNGTITLTMTVTAPVALANFKVNFSDAATPAPNGFFKDNGQAYADRGNGQTYGWMNTARTAPLNLSVGGTIPGNGRNRVPTPDVDTVNETLMHMQGNNVTNFNGTPTEGVWEALVPNGLYTVTVRVGDNDPENTVGTRHTINVEGINAINQLATQGSPNDFSGSVNVNVTDGKITLDAIGGLNTKIKSVSIAPASAGSTPYVVGVNPPNNTINVAISGFSISANNLFLPNPDVNGIYGVDNNTLAGNVRLVKVNGNVEIPSAVNGTAGGDAITLSPNVNLENSTTYRFEISSGVKDKSGVSFIPFSSTFTTEAPNNGGGNIDLNSVSFTKVTNAVATGAGYTSLVIGPDGKFYGLTIGGDIHRWTINADGTLANKETLSAWRTTYGNRSAVGLAFDPSATANNLIAYITHCSAGLSNAPDWDGKISKISGANLENEVLLVTNLPRSLRDHLVNSIAFKPGEPSVLYFNVGSNSAGGAPDGAWGNREESMLSGASLRLDLTKLPATLPLNAMTSRNANAIKATDVNSPTIDGMYNPYFINAPLTIFASGIRNAYDLVWHSNGQLYIPANGTAGGSNSPASIDGMRRPDGSFYNTLSNPAMYPTVPASNSNNVQRDWLFRVNPTEPIGYYGHPNPYRGEFVLNRGEIDVTSPAIYNNNNVQPDIRYRGAAFDFEFNKSPNGVIEYKSNAEGGKLKGAILVVRYSGGDDIIALVPDGANGNINTTKIGIPGFTGFSDPLDLIEDPNTGNIYVSEFGANKITLLRPSNQATATPVITLSPNKLIKDDVTGGAAAAAQTIFVSNTGNAPLTNITVNITGTNANQFSVNTSGLPTTINSGQTSSFTVTFNPTTNGPKFATVNVTGTDAIAKTVSLNGLGKQGTGGGNEPSLQWVLDTYFGTNVINVGDDNPATNIIHSSTAQQSAPLLGSEVSIQKFQSVTDGPVSIEVLSVFGPDGSNPVVGFGWYTSGNPNAKNELFTVINSPIANAQTLSVPTTGVLEFTPSTTDVFGFYSRWPAFANRHLYSEDALNTFSGAIPHHVRVYPHPTENNAYIIATEEHISGFDFQDVVVIVRNVKPFAPSIPTLTFNPLNLNFNSNLNGNPDVQSVTLSANVPLNGTPVTLTTNQPWVILPSNVVTGTPMAFDVNPQGLGAGTYTATVTAIASGYDDAELSVTLQITNEPSWTTKINFQDDSFTPPTSYIADIGLAYGDRGNGNTFGWLNSAGVATANTTAARGDERGITNASSDQVKLLSSLNMFQHSSNPNARWEIAVPNGNYTVKVSAGDPAFTDSEHTIRAEGTVLINAFVPTTQIANANAQGNVTVNDGKLTLDAVGGTNTKINYVLIAPLSPAQLAPIITANFTGSSNTPNIYQNTVSVALSAQDQSGSGIKTLSYSTNGGVNYTPYTVPIVFNQVATHNLTVKAEDNNGNISTQLFTFSVINYVASNAIVALENMTKIPGTQIGFPANDYYTFHKNQTGSSTALKYHNINVMRVKNTGTGTLLVNSIVISNNTRFRINKINNVAFTANMIPVSINAGAFADIELEFIESAGGKGVRTETVTLTTNADNAIGLTATLKGGYMTSVEGGNELNAIQTMNAFGFTTSMNGQPSPSSDYPLAADVDSGSQGDLIVSQQFAQADPTQPIRAVQLAAFKGSGPSTTKLINASGATLGSFSYAFGNDFHQSLLPKSTNTSNILAGDEAATITGNFRLQVDTYTTSGHGGTNVSTGLPNVLGVRVYKVKDRNGDIIPFHYIVIQDFVGSGCGAGSANCDWNDNMQYFINIRPSAVPTATAIASQTATVNQPFNFNIASSFNKGYPGNKLTYSANLSNLSALPTWLFLNTETGEFTGTAPLNAASPLSVAVTATDINGLTVTQTFTLNVIGTASGLAVVNKGHIDFGNTLSGSQNTQTLNVLNNAIAGGATMTLNSVQIIGANAAEFNASIVTNAANPQANASLNVTFTPQSNGLKQAVLLISNNFTATPLRVPLFGIGTDPCHTIQVVKRIKSGVNVNATVNGVVWENDQAYRSGNIKLDVPNVTSIAETSNDEVYIKYLSSNANLDIIQYNIPMPAGLYSVRLHFVENAFSAVNQRVFSGEIEGQSIFSNLDVFATVGRNTALVRDFSNITVGADNSMNIKFTPTVNRLALAGVEVFKFVPSAGALTFNANPTITNPTCASNNGSIQVSVSNTVGVVSYTLNGQSNSTGLFTSLSAGSYTITASDGSGCAVSQTFVLTSGSVDFTVSSTPVSCNSNNNGTATIGNIIGATGNVTVSWNTNPIQTTLTATGLAVGQYQVTLTDAIGCFKTQTVSVVKSAGCGATTTRLEAEDHFIIVADAPGNNIFIGNTDIASQNKDVRVYDVGDKIKFNFNAANAGQYILKMRGRSGWTTNTDAYWENPQGYGFKLDNATTTFVGNPSTISPTSSANFGSTGAFFGTMETQALDLTAGTHSLEIEMKRQWLVIDYIEILYLGSQGPDITPPSAPVLSLESIGTNAVALSWSAATDNVGVTAYDVFNGANLAGTTTSTNFTVNGLTAGLTYTFTVKAKDASANVSNASNPITATTNGGVDVTAPTAPTLTLGTVTGTSVALSWTAATDNVAVTAYEIFNGAASVGTTANLNFTVNGLSANTAYSFTVKAKDAANNSSVSSNAVNATTLNNADTQAPSAPTLTLGTVTNNSVALTWTAATDNVAVTAYEIFNGVTSVGTTANLNFTVNGLSANTAYSFTVKAKDAAGNSSVASNVVNATTTGGAIPTTTTRYEAETHYVIVSDVGTNGAIIVGNNNIASAGKDLRTYDIGDKFKIDFPVTGGQYQLKVHARSGYNASPTHYWNNPFGYTFRLDNVVTNFAANPSTVSATSTTAYGSVGAYFGTMETSTINLNAGTHSLEITINRTWLGVDYLEVIYLGGGTPDTQAPTAPVLSLGTVTANSVALNWTAATDNVAVTAYEVYQGANLITTTSNNSFNATGLTANTAYAFTVKAKDAVGNTSGASNVINATTLAPPTSVRFEAETNFTVVSNVGTNGNIVVGNNSIASAGKDLRAYDIGDKFNINFNVSVAGQYRLKVNSRAGWTANPTGYWTPAGYAYKLNGATTSFVGNPSTLSPTPSTAYGAVGATFGTMESGIVNLSAGAHSLEIEMLKSWLGVDYLEVEFLGSAGGVTNTNPTENAVEAKESVTLTQDISKLYPNPVSTDDIYVEFNGDVDGKVEYSILDAQGKTFTKQIITLDEPQYVIRIAIANLRLSQGVYYLYIKGDKLQERIIRFVKN